MTACTSKNCAATCLLIGPLLRLIEQANHIVPDEKAELQALLLATILPPLSGPAGVECVAQLVEQRTFNP